MRGRSAPPPRVTFPSRGKSPKARQGLRPWTCRCGVTALFALAALRSGSRRAAFCHRKRPICHFEVVGESVLFFSLVLRRKDFVLLIRGAGGWVARLGATLGLNGGIGEGVLRRRAGVLCSSVPVLCRFCAATNGLITPFISQLQRKHSIFIKRYFKIVYRKRVRKVLCFRCFRCFRCSCPLIGPRCRATV